MADPDKKPVKSKRTLGEYAAMFPYCHACGVPDGAFIKCDLHHIVKRGRSDERCNLIRLCGWRGARMGCHARAEAQGLQEEWLPLGVVLSLKKLRDPEGWNPERLKVLFLKNLPDLLPVPAALLAEFSRWQSCHPKGTR